MPSLAASYNIVADQGATFYRAFIKKDHLKRVIPLEGVSARMQLRETYESPTPIISMTTENNFIAIEEGRGIITVIISSNIMETIAAKKYVYDLELIYPDNKVERLVMGTFHVRREVTR
jgi:hypothetical protein